MIFDVTYNKETGYLYFDHGKDFQNRVGIPMGSESQEKLEGLQAIMNHVIKEEVRRGS